MKNMQTTTAKFPNKLQRTRDILPACFPSKVMSSNIKILRKYTSILEPSESSDTVGTDFDEVESFLFTLDEIRKNNSNGATEQSYIIDELAKFQEIYSKEENPPTRIKSLFESDEFRNLVLNLVDFEFSVPSLHDLKNLNKNIAKEEEYINQPQENKNLAVIEEDCKENIDDNFEGFEEVLDDERLAESRKVPARDNNIKEIVKKKKSSAVPFNCSREKKNHNIRKLKENIPTHMRKSIGKSAQSKKFAIPVNSTEKEKLTSTERSASNNRPKIIVSKDKILGDKTGLFRKEDLISMRNFSPSNSPKNSAHNNSMYSLSTFFTRNGKQLDSKPKRSSCSTA